RSTVATVRPGAASRIRLLPPAEISMASQTPNRRSSSETPNRTQDSWVSWSQANASRQLPALSYRQPAGADSTSETLRQPNQSGGRVRSHPPAGCQYPTASPSATSSRIRALVAEREVSTTVLPPSAVDSSTVTTGPVQSDENRAPCSSWMAVPAAHSPSASNPPAGGCPANVGGRFTRSPLRRAGRTRTASAGRGTAPPPVRPPPWYP